VEGKRREGKEGKRWEGRGAEGREDREGEREEREGREGKQGRVGKGRSQPPHQQILDPPLGGDGGKSAGTLCVSITSSIYGPH
jgi:hypothetical protein